MNSQSASPDGLDLELISALHEQVHALQDSLSAARSQRDAEIFRLVEQDGLSRYRIAHLLGMSESAIKKIVDSAPTIAFDEVHTIRQSPKIRASLEAAARSARR